MTRTTCGDEHGDNEDSHLKSGCNLNNKKSPAALTLPHSLSSAGAPVHQTEDGANRGTIRYLYH